MTDHEQDVLCRIVVDALKTAVSTTPSGEIPADFYERWIGTVDECPELRGKRASFISLYDRNDSLRGCIGSVQAQYPLWRDAAVNAAGAAVRDPRFPPVVPSEVDALQVEISVLGIPQELEYTDQDDLCRKLTPHRDGVVLSLRGRRATFLPQVWQRLPSADVFLDQLCRKAGLSSAAWRSEHPHISVYQVSAIGPIAAS